MDYVMVHDGARPLVPPKLVTQVAEEAIKSGAAILAIPVKDTIKEVKDLTISRTVPRETLWAAQTPQAFRRDLLLQAYAKAQESDFLGTDEASLLEFLGHPVRIVPGSDVNLKVTTPADLQIARAIYACGFHMAQVDSM
jgi:2-C-methyl-D-erythritol 4-phosphate cytidylyltransferase